ncbi:MAG: hypothetical protein LBQ54_12565 [Planctomycetaceae bacterium]|jgi:hypothetical protein|nr:hypothetical protein [Planctomycetaceae bacterium]
MQRRFLFIHFVSLSLALIVLSCCPRDRKPKRMPVLYSLQIEILCGNVPFAGALVRLFRIDADEGPPWSIKGITNLSGVAKMTTENHDGVPLGKYKVTIEKEEIVYDDSNPPQITGRIPLIEKWYSEIQTTPLTLEVTPDVEKITFDIGQTVCENIKLRGGGLEKIEKMVKIRVKNRQAFQGDWRFHFPVGRSLG